LFDKVLNVLRRLLSSSATR